MEQSGWKRRCGYVASTGEHLIASIIAKLAGTSAATGMAYKCHHGHTIWIIAENGESSFSRGHHQK